MSELDLKIGVVVAIMANRPWIFTVNFIKEIKGEKECADS
jgi:hypothetical protein